MAPKTGSLSDDAVVGDLCAMILLAGKVRPSTFSAQIGRSILDLPLDAERTLLDIWCEQASALARAIGTDALTVRIVVDQGGYSPQIANVRSNDRVVLRVERDPTEYRGTAGLLKDLAAGYPDEKWLLVGSASQLPLEPLYDLTAALSDVTNGISMVTHADGALAGMMLVRCRSLSVVPDVGFVDFKEQALPAIAKEHSIRVLRRERPTGLPILSLADYIEVLRVHHLSGHEDQPLDDPFAERWEPAFALIEDGAQVHATARLHDSVVLKGGVVQEGAVVVRSVVCPGGVVRRRSHVIEEIVAVRAG